MELLSPIDRRKVSNQQYLVELMFYRKSKKDNKPLPDKFWNHSLYKLDYKRQIVYASNLLKYFPIEDIISGLESKDGNWIYSLSYKGLIDVIKKHKVVKKIEKTVIENTISNIKEVDEQNIYKVSKPLPKKNIINKLRELDE